MKGLHIHIGIILYLAKALIFSIESYFILPQVIHAHCQLIGILEIASIHSDLRGQAPLLLESESADPYLRINVSTT